MLGFFIRFNRKKKQEFKEIKKITGFYPSKLVYYKIAFTHKSASFTHQGKTINNERLEYLGDAILDAIISDILYHKYTDAYEGFLTRMRSKIVNGEKLAELAELIGLTEKIRSKLKYNSNQKHVHEDAFEALVGAIYLDKGYKKTFSFIRSQVLAPFIDLDKISGIDTNYKSQLIEWGQKYKNKVEFITKYDGSKKYFIAKAIIHGEQYGTGKGNSKKEAEQEAAKNAMTFVKELF